MSLSAKVLVLYGVLVALAAALAAGATALGFSPWLTFLLVVGVGLLIGVFVISGALGRSERLLAALQGGVEALRVGDTSLRLATERNDELGELVKLYNELAETLGRERRDLRQREILLSTALETSPAALLLVSSIDRVVFANAMARRLFHRGRRLEGVDYGELWERCPEPLRRALGGTGDDSGDAGDAMVSVELDDADETFHVSRRVFELNARRHVLVMVRHLTAELRRQEATIWRKVLRVLGHEIHNSLAPIRSLARSGRSLHERDPEDERLGEILESIEESAAGLNRFVDGYREYARLPEPRRETLDLRSFLDHFRRSDPFQLEGDVPARTVEADPGQLRQVLHNLLKNARQAGSPAGEIQIRVEDQADDVLLHVLDRGRGMDEDTLARATLPFWSTKKDGTGLGLALCREILEAHGGGLDLALRPGGGVVVTCRLPG